MPLLTDVQSSFRSRLPELGLDWKASPVSAPEGLVFNEELAIAIGIDPAVLESPEGVAILAGNSTPAGATPIAMAYAGHQFGGYSPRLGDGRALLLGEVLNLDGDLRDVHLKGSGRTPFARGGDGRAALGPMLREYLIAEAMHALGIPTARALAVVATGEQVHRDAGPEPGAVLTRVAASHLRIGTFEYAARLGEPTMVQRLADYAIDRHYPELEDGSDRYLAFLGAVVDVQASLVARWMAVGFIHGVMNTDNMTISGETIDYGPCAFMDRYDPATVYSSIDHGGRYSYGNQPAIAGWNLARLAESLLPLIDTDPDAAVKAATDVLSGFADRFRGHRAEAMAAKFGLLETRPDDSTLFERYLDMLLSNRVDYTASFRGLAEWLRGNEEPVRSMFDDREALESWAALWLARLGAEGRDRDQIAADMDGVNPLYIPRNHLVDEALGAATNGDLAPFRELLAVVTDPFNRRVGAERFATAAPEDFDKTFRTYCGT